MAALQMLRKAGGSALTSAGRALDGVGKAMAGAASPVERLLPSSKGLPFAVGGGEPKTPSFADAGFVAPNSTVMGDVTIGADSSVWYGAVLRGDVHYIKIGSCTSIGDRATVHVAKIAGDFPTVIGDRVTVGPNAIVHACTLESDVVIGAAAQVLDGAVVKSNAIVAPGAVVPPGKVVESGTLWSGVPATYLRDLTPDEIDSIGVMAADVHETAVLHAAEVQKPWQQLLVDHEADLDKRERDPTYFQPLDKDKLESAEGVNQHGVPTGRIFNSEIKSA